MLKMKHVNLKNLYGSAKNAIINRNIAYNKSYTLLHRQLVKKDRMHLVKDVNLNILGKEYSVIDYYDIKSYSKEPYKPYSKEKPNRVHLGLNQLFVGQDPYKPYEGNPKKGIYHDKSQIHPKNFRSVSYFEYLNQKEEDKEKILITHTDSWGWEIKDYEYKVVRGRGLWGFGVKWTKKPTKYITKKNAFGFDMVSNLLELPLKEKTKSFFVYEKSGQKSNEKITCTYTQKSYKIFYKDGSQETFTVKAKPMFLVKRGETYTILPTISLFLYENLTLSKKHPPVPNLTLATRKHGKIIYQATIEDTRKEATSLADWSRHQKEWLRKGWSELKGDLKTLKTMSPSEATRQATRSMVIMFSDRTCVKITQGGFRDKKIGGKDGYMVKEMYPPSYAFIALVHKDTKELALSRVKFVEEWSKYFELYVYEKRSFWQKITAPFVALVTLILAPYLTYLALPAGVGLSTTITVLGIQTTAGALVGASGFFAGLGVIGSFARVPFLQVVSVVGGLTSGIVSSMWKTTTTKMLEKGTLEIGVKKLSSSMVTQTAQEASKKLTFGGILNYLKSNWLLALQSLLKVADTTASLLRKEIEPNESVKEEEEEESKVILEDEEEIILPDFIRYVMDIPDEVIKTKTTHHL